MKVKNFYNKNQFILEGREGVTFQSYDSEIANISKNGFLTFGVDWDYSSTTLRYLYIFLDEYFMKLESEVQEKLINFDKISNKKAYLQKLINENVIIYNKYMK